MAACLLTFTGTNGTVKIEYTLGSDINVLYSTYNDVIYIDDTATDITYETLTGDAAVTSGCLTVTAKSKIFYKFEWDVQIVPLFSPEIIYLPIFDRVILGTPITITDSNVDDLDTLIDSINCTLNDDDIKIVATKETAIVGVTTRIKKAIVIQILESADVPELRIKSPYDAYSYIKGTVILPAGFVSYSAIDTCINAIYP